MSNDKSDVESNAPVGILKRHSLERNPRGELINGDAGDGEKELTQEELAPEGGWGWMVALGMTITFTVMFSPAPCVSIIFGELLESSGSSGSSMTAINMIWTISWSISGLCTNVLLKKFPMRIVGISGALVFSSSWIMSAVAANVYQLGITFFTQGIGIGIMGTICQANFNAYFVKRRATIMSTSQIIMSVFGVFYPMMIGEMMEIFGFRGTAALIGAMSLNSVFGMLMMHPVERHLKNSSEVVAKRRAKMERKLLQEKSLSDTSKDIEGEEQTAMIDGTKLKAERSRWSSLGNLREDSSQHTLLTETLKARVASSSNVEWDPRSRVNSISRTPVGTSVLSSPSSSFGNLGVAIAEMQLRKKHPPKALTDSHNEKHVTILKEKEQLIAGKYGAVEDKEDQGTIEMILDLFDFSILKDCTFIIMCLGISAAISSDVIFSSLLPLAMFNSGYTTADASLAVAISCAAELVAKILLTFTTMIIDVRAKTLVFLAMIAMAFAKIAYFYLESTLTGIMVSMALIGGVRVWIFVPQSLVIVENYPVQKYAACYGIYSMISGLVFIAANPVFGIIKDLTGSFSVCQLALIALNCAFILPWGIELAAYYRNRRKQEKTDSVN